jgi:hypothetical protein
MKLNWGTGIAIFYTTFALAMVGLVIKSTFSPVLLIKKDYYDDDIRYQAIMDKKQNAFDLEKDVLVEYQASEHAIIVKFPENIGTPSGNITLFHPASTTSDLVFDIVLDAQKTQKIDISSLEKGFWRVKIDWQANNKGYLREEKVYF